ncbi:butyrophilin-like protein 2 [Chanos chanos]|uniref:Butyrophilin-like protein 2 n=1 Tax=Chanos chanos TaxID=29144 RepID=A0A6J2WHF1_CHACN|nr:butyrophilin-like protein 2 [Chanos chanos]
MEWHKKEACTLENCDGAVLGKEAAGVQIVIGDEHPSKVALPHQPIAFGGLKLEKMLTGVVWLIVSVSLCHAEVPDTFSVLVPDGSVSAELGASVVLPCGLSPSLSAVELEVRWHRPSKYNTPVLLYKDLKIQESPADPQYRDRVSLIGSLEEGNVSLKLERVTQSDRGEYECYVSSGIWYDKAETLLSIKILGSPPVLSVTETGGEQVNVTCVSDGWSPQPTVTWRDREGKDIKHDSNVMYEKDTKDLVSVSSWLLFSPSESEWISCSVSLSDQKKREGRVMPYIHHKPRDNVGMVADELSLNENIGHGTGKFRFKSWPCLLR